MPAKPSSKRLKNRTAAIVGGTPAEGPSAHPNRAANAGAGSIDAARQDDDDASGYTDLVAEVEALEARVTERTNGGLREDVARLRAKVEREPLKDERTVSVFIRKQNVDRVRAYAQSLAVQDFGG